MTEKYRIRVDVIDGETEELRAEARMGMECSGFTILMKRDDGTAVYMHRVGDTEIAKMIAESPEMMGAAILAKGMAEAVRYRAEMKSKALMKALMDKVGGEDEG